VRKSLNSRTFLDNRKKRVDRPVAKSYRPAPKLGIHFATDIEMEESDFREANNIFFIKRNANDRQIQELPSWPTSGKPRRGKRRMHKEEGLIPTSLTRARPSVNQRIFGNS
jgi:hypothetical protein